MTDDRTPIGRSADAAGVISPQAAAAQGILTVEAYWYNQGSLNLYPSYLANGVGFLLLGEFDSTNHHPIFDGAAVGDAQATKTIQIAHSIGMPEGAAMVWTADTNVPANQFEQTDPYVDAWHARCVTEGFRSMGYAGEDWLHLLLLDGRVHLGYGTAAAYWNHGFISNLVALRQLVGYGNIGGTTVDYDNVFLEDHGQVRPNGTAGPLNPTPTPIPVPDPGDDMPSHFLGCNHDGDYWEIDGLLKSHVENPEFKAILMGEPLELQDLGEVPQQVLDTRIDTATIIK